MLYSFFFVNQLVWVGHKIRSCCYWWCVCVFSAVTMFIGIVIFGVEATKDDIADPGYDLDWSFVMAVLGMCATIAAGVASAVHVKHS